MRLLAFVLTIIVLPVPAIVQVPTDNAEMTVMFDADQAMRKADFSKLSPDEISKVAAADATHRARTRVLLDEGKLTTGKDFWHAAFVFQHGSEPAEYLLAHSLAVAAAARGQAEATWIAAATLDRYLIAIGQPQVYGTQYQWKTDGPTTQEPYDRTLLSDGIRTVMGVPPIARQKERLAAIVQERGK